MVVGFWDITLHHLDCTMVPPSVDNKRTSSKDWLRMYQKKWLHTSSVSFLSSSSSSSSSSFSAFLSSSAFFASSSSFFFAFSASHSSFHFLAKPSASEISSVTMTLSKMVPALTCQRSKPMKPKSANLYTSLSSTYSG